MKQEHILLLMKWITWPLRPLMWQMIALQLVVNSVPFELDDEESTPSAS